MAFDDPPGLDLSEHGRAFRLLRHIRPLSLLLARRRLMIETAALPKSENATTTGMLWSVPNALNRFCLPSTIAAVRKVRVDIGKVQFMLDDVGQTLGLVPNDLHGTGSRCRLS